MSRNATAPMLQISNFLFWIALIPAGTPSMPFSPGADQNSHRELAAEVALVAAALAAGSSIDTQAAEIRVNNSVAPGFGAALHALVSAAKPVRCTATGHALLLTLECESLTEQGAIARHLGEARALLGPGSTIGALIAEPAREHSEQAVLLNAREWARVVPVPALHEWLLNYVLPTGISISGRRPSDPSEFAVATLVVILE